MSLNILVPSLASTETWRGRRKGKLQDRKGIGSFECMIRGRRVSMEVKKAFWFIIVLTLAYVS